MRICKGATLVELGVAFAILGLALLPVINLFSGSGRQARQTSDFTQGVTLTETVAEDLRLANWENPHLPEDLVADPQSGHAVSIVDGQSHWFEALEDNVPPPGQILPGLDAGITPASGTIYRQLRDFKLALSSTPRTLLTTGSVYDVDLVMSWTDFQRKTQDLPMRVILANRVRKDAHPSLLQDRAAADDQIRQTFYPEKPGTTLKDAVGPPPASLDAVRKLGDSVILINAILDTESAYRANIAGLRTAVQTAPAPLAKVDAQVALARVQEARASVRLAVMIFLAPRVEWLAAHYDIALLGTPTPPHTAYFIPVAHMTDLTDAMDEDLYRAESDFVKAYNQPLGARLPPRARDRLFFRLVDIHELRALTGGPATLATFQRFLSEFAGYQEGRNPNFASYARDELNDCRDIATLAHKYRQPERVKGYARYSDNAYGASSRILTGGL